MASLGGQSGRRIAISGHRGLPAATASVIDKAVRAALAELGADVIGLSCLADGADQIFARAVADAGGRIEAIIPAKEYRDCLPAKCRAEYDSLLALAGAVRQLPFAQANPQSEMAASQLMVDEADELYAVWDGLPARGYGGTADVVAYARQRKIPVHVIWPRGAVRDQP